MSITKGEWEIGRTNGPDIMIVGGVNRDYICTIHVRQTGGGAIAKSMESTRIDNAHFITAAPKTKQQRDNLLAAHEKVRSAIVDFYTGELDQDNFAAIVKEIVEEIVAKVEGK